MMTVHIIQPPLVQLNSPYPSGAYLSAFFKSLGLKTHWHDASLALCYELFSAQGLGRLFEHCGESALQKAEQLFCSGNTDGAQTLRRYISEKERWVQWIEPILAMLRDGGSTSGRECAHAFLFSPAAPRGPRMERFLFGLDHEPSVDDVRFLASMALADLADFIRIAYDGQFSLVRYAESLAIQETTFEQLEQHLQSPILTQFYEPVLDRIFAKNSICSDGMEKTLVCITVPFAGTFEAALYTGRFLKQKYGSAVFVVLGGGFVNTELRELDKKNCAVYFDALSFDRGYGSYKALLNSGLLSSRAHGGDMLSPMYKLRIFSEHGASDFLEHDAALEHFENEQTASLVPDFSDIDFSRYLRVVDDTNPMQRLWSDGTWIKAYLAHGCYWHQCAFCDVTLDYVAGYKPTDVQAVFSGLYGQAIQKGLRGIHFVDEAMPPHALTEFASFNLRQTQQLLFWGNIRFEKTFTRDVADFLACGGLTGVSGGIEIAHGAGLAAIHKGTDIDTIVAACCAFKEAGILVHAYMIYGWWQEHDQDIVDSMETLRQFYAAGLLDSSFWHKFVLTRHSRVYAEWLQGLHPDLHPVENKAEGLFAKNGLHFKGESHSEKFSIGLSAALNAWMHGNDLQKPVGTWFSFKTPRPSVMPDTVEHSIARYEQERDKSFGAPLHSKKLYWLGGEPLATARNAMQWIYQNEWHTATLPSPFAHDLCRAIWQLRSAVHDTALLESFMLNHADCLPAVQSLRGKGLVQLPWNIVNER